MSLLDSVRARRFEEWFPIDKEDDTQKFLSVIVDDFPRDPPVVSIRADNVAEYYFNTFGAVDGKVGHHIDVMRDFFNMAPPFPRFWVEYKIPGPLRNPVGNVSRVGVGFFATEFEPQYRTPRAAANILVNQFNQCHHATGREFERVEDAEQWLELQRWDASKPLRWGLSSLMFIEMDGVKDRVWGPMIQTTTLVSDDGSLCALPMIKHTLHRLTHTDHKSAAFAFAILSRPSLMAITFMHAKNVQLREGEPIPRKVQEKRKRNGKLPLVPYKVIDIHPVARAVKQVAEAEGISEREAIKRLRMRGHFKNYSERGLFGKHKGVYFWHAIDEIKTEDIMRRDYRVKPK